VSAGSAADTQPKIDRLEVIAERVAALRRRSELLTQQVESAAALAADTRARRRVLCNHGEQVRQMHDAVAELQKEIEGLRTAMATRGVIEQAKGMLMLQQHCSADEAFADLVHLSQTSGRKLFEVAETVVTTWTKPDRAP